MLELLGEVAVPGSSFLFLVWACRSRMKEEAGYFLGCLFWLLSAQANVRSTGVCEEHRRRVFLFVILLCLVSVDAVTKRAGQLWR